MAPQIDPALTAGRRPRPIESNTLLTEAAPDLEEIHDRWFRFYGPTSPGEAELLAMAIHSSTGRRRCDATLTALCNELIRTATVRHDRAAEDEVQHWRDLLPTQPGRAVLHLQRTALGCQFLMSRFERFLTLIREDGTLYGTDRTEMINLSSARAGANKELLFESSGAYLIWVYALAAQEAPKDEQFVELGNERYMPEELRDRETAHWLGPVELCRAILVELIEGALASLRAREHTLRVHFDEPSRAGAEVRAQVLRGPDGMQLARLDKMHRQNFLQAYQAFLKGRKESLKTGRAPGAAVAGLEGALEQPAFTRMSDDEAEAGRRAAKAATEARAAAAALVSPGPKNGIGARQLDADFMIRKVRASAPPPWEAAPPSEPVIPEETTDG
jgi:hypothetical protein